MILFNALGMSGYTRWIESGREGVENEDMILSMAVFAFTALVVVPNVVASRCYFWQKLTSQAGARCLVSAGAFPLQEMGASQMSPTYSSRATKV